MCCMAVSVETDTRHQGSYRHNSWEKISVQKVGNECCLIATPDHSNRYSDGFLSRRRFWFRQRELLVT